MAEYGGGENKNLPMREKMDFQEVLFQQMIEIMKNCHDPVMFEDSVTILEATLTPYLDNTYDEDHEKIIKKYNSIVKSCYDRYNRQETNKVDGVKTGSIMEIYKALMRLARRKGLLPEEVISHIMGEEL